MNSNILQMDVNAHIYAFSFNNPAMVVFDFKEAFLSASHDFMWKTLERLGPPSYWIQTIRLFVRGNQQFVGRDS